VIFQVGLLGVVSTLTLASRTLAEAEQTERVVIEAGATVDRLASGRLETEGSTTFHGGRVEWGALPVGTDTSRVLGITSGEDTVVVLTVERDP